MYHKPPDAFVVRRGAGNLTTAGGDAEDEDESYDQQPSSGNDGGGGVDLLDMGGMAIDDNAGPVGAQTEAPMTLVTGPEKSGGLEVYAGFRQVHGKIMLDMEVTNVSVTHDVSQLAIQLNKNAFGLSPISQQVVLNPPASPGNAEPSVASIPLQIAPNMLAPTATGQPANPQVQVAIKNLSSGNVFYFAAPLNLEALFTSDGAMDRSVFIESWKNIDDRNELYATVGDLPPESVNIEAVQAKFAIYNIFFIARRPVPSGAGQEVVYFSMSTVSDMQFLAELTFKQGVNACKICLKTEDASFGPLAKKALEDLLRD